MALVPLWRLFWISARLCAARRVLPAPVLHFLILSEVQGLQATWTISYNLCNMWPACQQWPSFSLIRQEAMATMAGSLQLWTPSMLLDCTCAVTFSSFLTSNNIRAAFLWQVGLKSPWNKSQRCSGVVATNSCPTFRGSCASSFYAACCCTIYRGISFHLSCLAAMIGSKESFYCFVPHLPGEGC